MYLVINPSDIFALTGVHIHDPLEVMILLHPGKSILFCDARTRDLFDHNRFEIVDRPHWKAVFGRFRSVTTDPEYLTRAGQKALTHYGPKILFARSPTTHQRRIKSIHEIDLLRSAQTLNKELYEMIYPSLQVGMTERELAQKIHIWQLELGAEGSAFPSIVAFGDHSAIPHHAPTDRRLVKGEWVLIDMGLRYGGYCSDMTRCFRFGEACIESGTKNSEATYELLKDIVSEIIQFARPGMTMREIDQLARRRLGTLASHFTHSLGHGVGIDIHESPRVSSRSREKLRPGMVITLEPGVYLPGLWGARYEEMVLVGEDVIHVL